MPTNSDPLAGGPSGDFPADRIDDAGNLMSRNSRILDAGPESLLGKGVAVANAAGLDFDTHAAIARLGDFAFTQAPEGHSAD